MGLAGVRARSLKASRESWDALLDVSGPAETHSSLAADDLVFPPMGCSAIARAGIRNAIRSFDAALILLDADSTVPATAAVGDLREALVHVAHAMTVLSPRRSERVNHALRIAWTAFSGPDERSRSLAAMVPFPSPLVVGEVASLLAERSFGAGPRWFEISSVRVATGYVRQHVADPDLFEATVRYMWELTDHERPVRDDAVACAETVALTIDRALELWAVRSAAALTPETEQVPASGRNLFARSGEAAVDPFRAGVGAGRRRRTH